MANDNKCPGCGGEVKGNICHDCGFCHKPLEAYLEKQIEYGHIAMDKMSSDEWKIANAIRAERKRAAAEGR